MRPEFFRFKIKLIFIGELLEQEEAREKGEKQP